MIDDIYFTWKSCWTWPWPLIPFPPTHKHGEFGHNLNWQIGYPSLSMCQSQNQEKPRTECLVCFVPTRRPFLNMQQPYQKSNDYTFP